MTFPQSVRIWKATLSGGVGPLCFEVGHSVYQDVLEHFTLSGEADFSNQQDLAPSHTAKSTNLNPNSTDQKLNKESIKSCQEYQLLLCHFSAVIHIKCIYVNNSYGTCK